MTHGVPPERIVIDPGHDLNKNTRHSLELTRRLGELASFGLPILVALSNKDFVGETLDRPRDGRLSGSLAAAVFCATQGARIMRVHNVAETVDALRMVEAILGWREPAYLLHNTRPEGND
jgi:dihydropteroate synthase